MTTYALPIALTAVLLPAYSALAQTGNGGVSDTLAKPATTDTTPLAATPPSLVPTNVIQHIRPQDQRGLNVCETPKEPGVALTGFQVSWGAAFTQQFQGLRHEN